MTICPHDKHEDYCEECEREFQECRARISEAWDELNTAFRDITRERDTALERVKVLEEALIRLRDCDWTISLPDRMDAVRAIAREALGNCPKSRVG